MIKDQVVRSPVVIAMLVAGPVAAQVDPAGLAAAVRTTATTRIEQPATLTSSQDLTFAMQAAGTTTRVTSAASSITTPLAPVSATAVTGTTLAAAGGGNATATTTGSGSSRRATASASLAAPVAAVVPATFTVAGDSGQAISVTVPPTVELESGGGGTAQLSTTSSLVEGPQFLGGNFAGGGTLSFAVGGQLLLASNSSVSAGSYNGVLMVVAQYN